MGTTTLRRRAQSRPEMILRLISNNEGEKHKLIIAPISSNVERSVIQSPDEIPPRVHESFQ